MQTIVLLAMIVLLNTSKADTLYDVITYIVGVILIVWAYAKAIEFDRRLYQFFVK